MLIKQKLQEQEQQKEILKKQQEEKKQKTNDKIIELLSKKLTNLSSKTLIAHKNELKSYQDNNLVTNDNKNNIKKQIIKINELIKEKQKEEKMKDLSNRIEQSLLKEISTQNLEDYENELENFLLEELITDEQTKNIKSKLIEVNNLLKEEKNKQKKKQKKFNYFLKKRY